MQIHGTCLQRVYSTSNFVCWTLLKTGGKYKRTRRQKPTHCLSAFVAGIQVTRRLRVTLSQHLEDRSNSTSQLGTSLGTVIPMAILMETSTHFQDPIVLPHWDLLLDHSILEYFYLGTPGYLLQVHCFFIPVSHIIYINLSRNVLLIKVCKEIWETHHLF